MVNPGVAGCQNIFHIFAGKKESLPDDSPKGHFDGGAGGLN
jgi:hypothetical protein